MILIVDNYDSFTYNLVQLLGLYTQEIRIIRNDKITLSEIENLSPAGIIISPGPGRPENAGNCVEIIKNLGPKFPILGVCLGLQAIGYAFGAQITHAPSLMHGKTSKIYHKHAPIYRSISNPFEAARYHSLVVSPNKLPPELEITALADETTIMGLKHREFSVEGIQFHPESILTKEGPRLIANWFNSIKTTV